MRFFTRRMMCSTLEMTKRKKKEKNALMENKNINAEIVKDHRSALMIDLFIVVKTVWGVFTED